MLIKWINFRFAWMKLSQKQLERKLRKFPQISLFYIFVNVRNVINYVFL